MVVFQQMWSEKRCLPLANNLPASTSQGEDEKIPEQIGSDHINEHIIYTSLPERRLHITHSRVWVTDNQIHCRRDGGDTKLRRSNVYAYNLEKVALQVLNRPTSRISTTVA